MDTKYIINKFGGIRPMAKLLGCPASTVQNWADRGNIPSTKIQSIIQLGLQEGVKFSLHDFFPVQLPVRKTRKPRPE